MAARSRRAARARADMQAEAAAFPEGSENARRMGHGAVLTVPLLREGRVAIGTISSAGRRRALHRAADRAAGDVRRPGGHRHRERAAVPGARDADGDLSRSVDQLTALGEVGQAVCSSLDLQEVLTTIVARRRPALAAPTAASIYEYDEAGRQFELRTTLNADDGLVQAMRATRLRKGEGAVGQAAVTLQPVQIADVARRGRLRGLAPRAADPGGRARRPGRAAPARRPASSAALVIARNRPGGSPRLVALLQTFATQSALAIENARLFRSSSSVANRSTSRSSWPTCPTSCARR